MERYFSYKIENLLVVSKIVTLNYLTLDKDFSNRDEQHDFWEFVFADKGEILCRADGKVQKLKEGEILFHKPKEAHSLACNGEGEACVLVVCFACRSEAMNFFAGQKYALDKRFRTMIYTIIEEGRKTFDIPFSDPSEKKMKLRANPVLGGMQLIKNNLENVLISLMREHSDDGLKKRFVSGKEEIARLITSEVIALMENRLNGRLTVDEICERTNYSRSYLFREFRAVTGKSMMEYYTERKIGVAATLLCETALSVSEISEKLGFDTPNYFSKTFKKIKGCTPLTYRKREK